MTAKNDITGDEIKSRGNSNEFADGWERIFGKKKDNVATDQVPTDQPVVSNQEDEK